MKNYYLDKDVNINELTVSGSIINIKSEKTFNNYNNLYKLSSLVDLENENSVILIDGNLIIQEWKNYDLIINGNTVACNIETLD